MYEFDCMLINLDIKLADHELKEAFEVFDVNNSGGIK